MTDAHANRHRLSIALGKTMDRFVQKNKGIDILDVVAALGVAGGAMVAVNVPPGIPQADIMLAEALGLAFGEGVKQARLAKAS